MRRISQTLTPNTSNKTHLKSHKRVIQKREERSYKKAVIHTNTCTLLLLKPNYM